MNTRKGTNRNQRTNEPRFSFAREWLDFIRQLPDNDQTALYTAILHYGLGGKEPQNLTGVAADYFADTIRPDLDKQLKSRKRVLL